MFRQGLDEEHLHGACFKRGCSVPDHSPQQCTGRVPDNKPWELPDQERAVRAVVGGADQAGDDGLQGEGSPAAEGAHRAEADTDGLPGRAPTISHFVDFLG